MHKKVTGLCMYLTSSSYFSVSDPISTICSLGTSCNISELQCEKLHDMVCGGPPTVTCVHCTSGSIYYTERIGALAREYPIQQMNDRSMMLVKE